ncbi:putative ras-related GTP-binding protein [Trypanosoma conorhini]|uniref:Putative ras-related GTP-binding protein n=1 Tax=Trypanosoma conorhini TaxID=83891 RepID=A0A3R7KPB6_9TRYP|nr:putative ras-related GTP-binding protein [Trypanosoma conorhini]RNE98670.1 putative ras-related GTP-binding protein [Trypanosoma conorhini]
MELWDTTGQGKHRAMAPICFRRAAAAPILFDGTVVKSFDELEAVWLPELLPHMKYSTEFIVVCGNKCDAVATDGQREGVHHAEEVCRARGLAFLHTSARNGQNVHGAFGALVDSLLTRREEEAAMVPDAPVVQGPQ